LRIDSRISEESVKSSKLDDLKINCDNFSNFLPTDIR
jgi:hypothetical protein